MLIRHLQKSFLQPSSRVIVSLLILATIGMLACKERITILFMEPCANALVTGELTDTSRGQVRPIVTFQGRLYSIGANESSTLGWECYDLTQTQLDSIDTQDTRIQRGPAFQSPNATTARLVSVSGPSGTKKQVVVNERVIIDPASLTSNVCQSVQPPNPSPNGQWYLVILECFEAMNLAYLISITGDHLFELPITVNGNKAKWLTEREIEYEPDAGLADEPACGRCDPVHIEIPATVSLENRTQQLKWAYRVAGVLAGDNLNMRAEPHSQSRIIYALPPNEAPIEIMQHSLVNNSDASWVYVRWVNRTGWVNKKYLRPYVYFAD